jgi:hypothetical protein
MRIANAQQLAKLTKLREQVVELDAQIDDIEQGTLTVDEGADRLIAHVRERAKIARTRLRYYLHPGGVPHMESIEQLVADVEVVADPAAFEERVRAAMAALVPEGAVAIADRPKAIKPLADKRRKLAVAVETEVCNLEGQGIGLARDREKIDPQLMLEVWESLG